MFKNLFHWFRFRNELKEGDIAYFWYYNQNPTITCTVAIFGKCVVEKDGTFYITKHGAVFTNCSKKNPVIK